MKIRFSDLKKIREENKDKVIVFARGTFDLIHFEHARFFQELKSHGDVVVIGIANNESVRTRKGKERPIIDASERLEVVDAMKNVDYVFELPLPPSNIPMHSGHITRDILNELRPDKFVTSYKEWIDKSDEIKREYGTTVVYFQEQQRNSTTRIIKTIIERYKS